MNKMIVISVLVLKTLVGYSGDSAYFLLDTMLGETLITAPIAYNSTWIGDNSSAEVVISVDGSEIMRRRGEGDFAWSPITAGKHTLTYTTYINGIAQDEVYEVTVFKGWKYVVEDGKAVIIETSENSGHVSIPMEIDGYRVDGLKDGLFFGCDNITSVSMPGCLLTKISDIFPDSFQKLTSITLLDGAVEIPEGAFAGCTALREVIIPKSVVKIGKNVFEGCSSLDLVTQDGFIICQGWCLGYAGGAAISLCIPNGVYGVVDGAFKDRTSLRSITFPTSLRFIGEDAFAGCTGIEEILLPEGLARVNDRAFCNCTYAQTVKLPSTLQEIGDRAFENCTSFSSVECPDALKIIGAGAFSNCWRMLSVSLPVGVESIGENAFLDCRRLIGVSVPTHLKTIKELFPSAYANLATIEIADTENTLVPRIFAECSSLIEVEIPEGIRLIPEEAFVGCSAVQSFNIPNTITNIGARAFSGLTQMTSFAFPAEVETIADEAFAGCVNLASLSLPEGVQYIGRRAFSGLSLLARADIPGTVVEMGDSPFAGCGQVRAVSMPGNVATVKSLFPDAYGEIVSASVTVGTTCVVDRLFADCTKLTSVDLPSTLVEIGEYAFENCTLLADIGIPSGVERLGEGAFLNCASLAKIALPNRLVIIPYRAFAGCETLAEIVIPENVSELDDSIFVGCSRLSKVYFVGNAPSCTLSAYDGVSASLVTYVENGSTGWDGIETSKTLPEFWPEGRSNLITYWTPNRYDVTFNLSGGGDSFDVEQVTGTTYILPLDPKRKGAVFDGWWTSLDGGARVTAVTPVDLTRPHTFYARWTFNAYSVVFDANGGSGEMEDQRLTVETPVQLQENGFTRPGYEFLGWATEPDGEVVYSDKAEVVNLAYDNNAIVTLYAVWNEREWTWADAVNATSIGLVFSGDGDNDAEWEIDYSTSHDGVASLRSGSIGASTAYPERTMSTVKTVVVGEGIGEFWWKVNCEEMDAEYDEWYDYVVFTIDGEEVAKIAGDSGWQKVEYIITGAGKHTLAWTFTRDHYDEEGAGWENAAWLDEFVWTPNPVTVTFDAGGADGDVPDPVVKYAGYELTLPGAGTLNNGEYVFRGWSDGETTYQAGTTYVFGSDDVTLTAVWELKVWTFAEVADAEGLVLTTGGDAYWTIDATSGYTNTMSVKSGVVVSGQESWIETKVNGSGILTFRWKVMGGQYRDNPFAYAKVVVDDTEVASEYQTDGWEEVSLTIEGDKEHRVRWIYLRTSTRVADGDCAWIDAVTWMGGARFDITYENLKGATHQNPSAYYAGMSLKFTVPSMVDGYAFTGWMPSEITASDTGNKIVTANWEWTPQDALVDASITGGKPITVKADWVKTELEKKFGVGKKDEFIAKFGDNLTSAMTKKTGKRDSAGKELLVWHDYVAGTDPTDVKSTFKAKIEMQNGKPIISWEPNLNSLGEERVYTVYGKESLSDIWHSPIAVLDHFFKVDVLMPYDVTVILNTVEGSSVGPLTVRVGQPLGELPTPTRVGYTFLGWFTAQEGGEAVTPETIVTADTTIYARWEKNNPVTVHDKVQLWEGGPYWATTNIGAENPEDYGYYFWWGDTVGYKRENDKWVASDGSNSNFSFTESNTPTYGKDNSTLQSEGWITADGALAPEHDAAHKHWGGNWRMPTRQEFDDLNSKCDWTWGSLNGVYGYVVRGRDSYASNSIFLPCAGYGNGTSLYLAGSNGYYLSSVPHSGDDGIAWLLYFDSGDHFTGYSLYDRYNGQSVRPLQGFTK